MAEDDYSAEGTPTSSLETLRFLDLVRQLSANPTAGKDWRSKDITKFLAWLLWESDLTVTKPERHRQDIFVLHCLLTAKVFHIDDLVRPLQDGVVETALSLAVRKNDAELVTYLLKTGASPDVLIGPVVAGYNRPALFASDRPCPMFASLLLEHGKAPSRIPDQTEEKLWELEHGMKDHRVFLRELQTNNIVQRFDIGVEYELAQMATNPEIIETWTRIQRAFMYARLHQRRPHGPLESELVHIGQLLTYKGDISVDSYLIDELIERKTALYEAMYRKNLPVVEWLLKVHHANPDQECMTGQLLWNDDVAESYPIENTLRGFLVSSMEESAEVGQMMDLLIEYGCSDLAQTTSLMRILKDNVSLQLVCMEQLHFMHMTDRIYDRTPAVFTEELRVEFNRGIPTILRECERNWFELVLDSSVPPINLDHVLLEMPAFLQRITPPDRFVVLPQSFALLTGHRAYRSLAVLFIIYGARQSMVESYSGILDVPVPHMEAIYNNMYRDFEFQVEDVRVTHKTRVVAFMTILARFFPMTVEVRRFLLKYFRVLMREPNALLPASVYRLQNRCVSVIQQEVLAGRIQRRYVASRLPPTLHSEVYMSERELSTVAAVKPEVV